MTRSAAGSLPAGPPAAPAAAGNAWLLVSLAGATLGWGWAWVGIRAAVPEYGAGPLALGRYVVATLVLLPFWLARGARLPQRRDWPAVAVMGLLGFTFYNLAVNQGEKTISAGTAALIAACIPVIQTIGGRFFFQERLTPAGWTGVALALGGALVTSLGAEGHFDFSLGAWLVLAGAVALSSYGLLCKRLLRRYRSLDITTWAIAIGTLGMLPFGLDLPAAVGRASPAATVTVVLLGVLPGALCYALWAVAFSRLSMARVSSWQFLIPLAAIAFGWLLLHELPPQAALIGGALTLGGVLLVNLKGHPAR